MVAALPHTSISIFESIDVMLWTVLVFFAQLAELIV